MKAFTVILLLSTLFGGGVIATDNAEATSAADSLTATSAAKEASATAGPRISFAERFVDLGRFYADSVKTCSLGFVSIGDATLVIRQVTADCGCTNAHASVDSIAPGDSATIVVRFNGSGRRPGPFKKIVRVRSNAVNSPLERLYITGTIKRNDKNW